MKRKVVSKVLFVVASICISFCGLNAQTHATCGYINPPEEIERLKQNIAGSFQATKMATQYIPVQFHIVGRDNGSGYASKKSVLDALCKLNIDYAPMDFVFYLKDTFNYLNSSTLYEINFPNIGSAVNQAFNANKVDSAINVFVGSGLSSGNSGFYTSGPDVIYMDNSFTNGNVTILSHEVGHYFSLAHPFFGWETTTYDSGNPTPTTLTYGGQTYNVEYVDRSINCDNSGDFLCDTPADYILDWSGPCDYQGGAVDPDSVKIDPDEANIMAYYSFTGCTDFHFSPMQMDVMMNDYMNRPELLNAPSPAIDSIETLSTLMAPINDEDLSFNQSATFAWSAVDLAEYYFIEIGRFDNFFFTDFSSLTRDTSWTDDFSFLPNADYFWRVWAFNDANTCKDRIYSEVGRFTTSVPSSNQDVLERDITLQSNVVNQRNQLFLSTGNMTGNITVDYYDLGGRLIDQRSYLDFNAVTVIDCPLTLPRGMSIIRVSNGNLFKTFKVLNP